MVTITQPGDAQLGGATQVLTFGQRAVGLNFNPSNDPQVQNIKELFAAAIDFCNDRRTEAADVKDIEKVRQFSLAITDSQIACMWAVKSVTWK